MLLTLAVGSGHRAGVQIKEGFSKSVSVCFYQHAYETPNSIFGLAGVVRIEYSVEGVCGAQRPWSETFITNWLE